MRGWIHKTKGKRERRQNSTWDDPVSLSDSGADDPPDSVVPLPAPKYLDAHGALEILSGSAAVRRRLAAMFEVEGIDHRNLAGTATQALALWPPFKAFLFDAQRDDVRSIEGKMESPEFLDTFQDPLFHRLMRKTIVRDLAMERLITILRRLYLQWVESPEPRLEPGHLDIVVSLACQCFNNEYVYAVSPLEQAAVERLGARLRELPVSGNLKKIAGDVSVYGMYVALCAHSAAENISGIVSLSSDSVLNELIVRQVAEPQEETMIREGIRSFGMSEDPVSAAVRRQYEESPYPRWFDLQLKSPIRFPDFITERFPFLGSVEMNGPVNILVAGCGTGQHPLHVAARYQSAHVIAIDFSKASLAYAIRQARRYGLSNIEFLHGDLLCINRLERQFDIVEALGVLHHMADPIAGLRALTCVLHEGGFMRIGLYSQRARQALLPARSYLESRHPGFSPNELRAIRQEVLATGDTVHLKYGDFFYTSGFRDLLLHAREVEFKPAELRPILTNLGLRFLGYSNIGSAVRAEYHKRFPEDPDMRDLDLIDQFEAQNPDMFLSLQVFWVRKEA
jgi:SAM-dependent methyltransferase